MPRIAIKCKAEIIKEYIIGKKDVTIGRRKGNEIVLDDEAVSEEHCIITSINDVLQVEDFNTAFGTTVNGKSISKQEINAGDEIRVGSHLLVIKPSEQEKVSGEKDAIGVSQPEAYFLGIQGKMEGRKFEMNPVETRIGRAKDFNDIWISKDVDKSVSRRHTTIRYTDGNYVLTDRRSRNRTFVNQQQVSEEGEVVLKDGDEILIGKSIFRFIAGNKEDFSLPKKAGIFWIRFLPQAKRIFSILLIVAGMVLIYKGMRGLAIISARPGEIYLDNLDWNPENFVRTWKGYLPEGTFDIIPSPAIGDVSNDGIPDVVMADASGKVYAWSGINGDLLWMSELGQSMLTSPVLADMNDDGILDVTIGSDNSRVYILDGTSGQMLYKSHFIGGKLLFGSSPLIVDVNQDGLNDVVVVTNYNTICFLYSPIVDKQSPYYFKTPEEILSSPVFIDAEMGKVAVATCGGKIYLFDALDQEKRDVINVTQKINMLEGVSLILNEISSVPAVADLNGDGISELVFTTGAYYIVALNLKNQSLMWAYKIRPFSTLATPRRYASVAIADFNMDGVPDVVTGWANGKIIALNGASGELIWEYDTGQANRIISSIALADFNKDGIMDPVVTGEDGSVFILDGSVNAKKRMLSNRESVQSPITSTPAIGDINGDGYLEIVLASVNNSIHVFTTPTRVFKNQIFWHSFRHDVKNTGNQSYSPKNMLYRSLTGSGVVLILGVFAMAIIAKKKKFNKRPKVIGARKK